MSGIVILLLGWILYLRAWYFGKHETRVGQGGLPVGIVASILWNER